MSTWRRTWTSFCVQSSSPMRWSNLWSARREKTLRRKRKTSSHLGVAWLEEKNGNKPERSCRVRDHPCWAEWETSKQARMGWDGTANPRLTVSLHLVLGGLLGLLIQIHAHGLVVSNDWLAAVNLHFQVSEIKISDRFVFLPKRISSFGTHTVDHLIRQLVWTGNEVSIFFTCSPASCFNQTCLDKFLRTMSTSRCTIENVENSLGEVSFDWIGPRSRRLLHDLFDAEALENHGAEDGDEWRLLVVSRAEVYDTRRRNWKRTAWTLEIRIYHCKWTLSE